MRERPILINERMVRGILTNRKTQTRRVTDSEWNCPYGGPKDRLWVRETWRSVGKDHPRLRVEYRADMSSWGNCYLLDNEKVLEAKANEFSKQRWKPSSHMPRWASRLTLEIVSTTVERLQDISEGDALAEGISKSWSDDQGETPGRWLYHSEYDSALSGHASAVEAFRKLWDSINGKTHPWASNPFVWVISFRKL